MEIPSSSAPARLLRALASPRWTLGCLVWLFVLTFWGTVYEAEAGLYAAQQTFFHSWYFRPLRWLALPGMRSTMAVFFVNRLASMAVRFRGGTKWIGLWPVHLGLIVLLAGAFVARQFAHESTLTLAAGESASVSVSDTEWELAVWSEGGADRRVTAFDLRTLAAGRRLDVASFGLSTTVRRLFAHCAPTPDGAGLREAPCNADPTRNIPGLMLEFSDGAAQPLAGQGDPLAFTGPRGETVFLALRHARLPLPVTVKLLAFEKAFHPNSQIARRFASRVEIQEGGGRREVTISMNRPFRLGAHTLFQSSYGRRPDGVEFSVLAVAENRGRLLPYWATGITFAGLLLHYLLRLFGVRRRAGAALAALGLGLAGFAPGAAAAPALPMDDFEQIPVMENGRLMPMDSYAHYTLLQLSGRGSLTDAAAATWWERAFLKESAPHWLARAMFEPSSTANDPLFLVNHPDVAEALGLGGERGPRFRCSYAELDPKLEVLVGMSQRIAKTDEKQRSAADREIMRLTASVSAYLDIVRGDVPAVFPAGAAGGAERAWIGPVEAAARTNDAALASALGGWSRLAATFRDGAAADFGAAAAAFRAPEGAPSAAAVTPREASQLRGEHWMNRLAPFARARLGYGLVFLAALVLSLGPRPKLRRAAIGVALLALALHTGGLLLRAFIMGRPPVTNLYSTFVFVAWVCVALGLGVERAQRNALGLLVGGLGGFALLFLAGRYELDGDTMQRVVAVLDSNLWLTAHVLTIAIGFAGFLMAGLAGHVYLLQRWRRPGDAALWGGTYRAMYGLLAFGFTFSFLGTMLGGVWADQSWGRFWGWDPKENGALLVLLWGAILLHARPNGFLADRGLAAGCVLGNVVVLLAWLGVNLLGVGLHTYGFTGGAAFGLLAFTAAEFAFLAALLPLTRRV